MKQSIRPSRMLVQASVWFLVSLLWMGVSAPPAWAGVVIQSPGSGFVAFEAEATSSNIVGTPEFWTVESDAQASGSAALRTSGVNNSATSPHAFALYEVRFASAGTYFLYYRWKADPTYTAGDQFTANSAWIGKLFGSYTTLADQAPFYRSDSNNSEAPANNAYSWKRELEANVYAVGESDVTAGVALTLTLGTREAGMTFDRFVLSTEPALTPAQLDALANSDTDIIVQGGSEGFLSFEAESPKATIVAGTPEFWAAKADAEASGTSALIAGGVNNSATSPHSFALYQLRFQTEGTYFLYYRWKADPTYTAGDQFTANSSWIGKLFGSYTTLADQAPFYRSDSNNSEAPANNAYSWRRELEANVYTVTAEDVQNRNVLTLTLGTREAGMIFDRLVFSPEAALTPAQLDALPNSGAQATPPELVKAVASESFTSVTVDFTRPVNPTTVVKANFVLSGGASVLDAVLSAEDERQVLLTTSRQTEATTYTLTVNGVRDVSGTAIAANSNVNFSSWKRALGWVKREIYFTITGTTVDSLKNDPRFPNKPDRVEWIRAFEHLNDPFDDNYGVRLSAFFTPSESGAYNFYYYNDDEAELLLSSDDSAGNLTSLGIFPLAAAPYDESRSVASSGELAGGKSYLLVAHLKQGTGDALLSVAARSVSNPTPAIEDLKALQGALVSAFVNPDLATLTFLAQPGDQSVVAGARARFSVKVGTSQTPVYYQWFRNGVAIPEATRSAYTTPVSQTADAGSRYSVRVSVAGSDFESRQATLAVQAGPEPSLTPYIGINFVGGGGGVLGGTLRTSDVAGVVPQENFNSVIGSVAADLPLNDSSDAATPVTLNLQAAGPWYTGSGISFNDADSVLLQGYIHGNNAPVIVTLNNVPRTLNSTEEAKYQLLVYSIGFSFNATYEQAYSVVGAETYPELHVQGQIGLQYVTAPGFVRMNSTNPDSRELGNYVQFDNIAPASDGSITLTVTPETLNPGLNYGPPINAIQLLVQKPGSVQPTLRITRTPSGIELSWTADAGGFVLESTAALNANPVWTSVAGTPNPVITAGSLAQPFSGSARYYRLRQ